MRKILPCIILPIVFLSACTHHAQEKTVLPHSLASSSNFAKTPEGAVLSFLVAADKEEYDEACSWLSSAAVLDVEDSTSKKCVDGLKDGLVWFDYDDDAIGKHTDVSAWTTETSLAHDHVTASVHVVLHNGGDTINQKAVHSVSGWQVSTLEPQD